MHLHEEADTELVVSVNKEKPYRWWAWILLVVLFGAGGYVWIDGAIDRWRISHFDKLSPEEQRRIAYEADREIQAEAEKRCAGVSDRLMDGCIAAMKEKIDNEDHMRFYQEYGEP